jgi:hypothetical protein
MTTAFKKERANDELPTDASFTTLQVESILQAIQSSSGKNNPISLRTNVAKILQAIHSKQTTLTAPEPLAATYEQFDFGSFVRLDWGIHFGTFFEDDCFNDLRTTLEAMENFRCFWIHIAMALTMHPFQLQEAFRQRARHMLDDSQHVSEHFFLECLQGILKTTWGETFNNFVDASILQVLWPKEFHNRQIIICKLDKDSLGRPVTSWYIFDPTPDDCNEEIVLRLYDGHYTLMIRDSRGKPLRELLQTFGHEMIILSKNDFAKHNAGIWMGQNHWPQLAEDFIINQSLVSAMENDQKLPWKHQSQISNDQQHSQKDQQQKSKEQNNGFNGHEQNSDDELNHDQKKSKKKGDQV